MSQAGLKLVLDRPASGDVVCDNLRCLSGTNSCSVCIAEGKIGQPRAQRFYLIFMNLNFVVLYFLKCNMPFMQ